MKKDENKYWCLICEKFIPKRKLKKSSYGKHYQHNSFDKGINLIVIHGVYEIKEILFRYIKQGKTKKKSGADWEKIWSEIQKELNKNVV